MEAVSYIAGEKFGAYPKCVCTAVANFMISFNDSLPNDEERNKWLKPLVPSIIGSRAESGYEDTDVLKRRSVFIADAVLRKFIPLMLDIAAGSYTECGKQGWAEVGAKLTSENAAMLRVLPMHYSFKELEGVATAVRYNLKDLPNYHIPLGLDGVVTKHNLFSTHDLQSFDKITDLTDPAVAAAYMSYAVLICIESIILKSIRLTDNVILVYYAAPYLLTLAKGCELTTYGIKNKLLDKFSKTCTDVVLELLTIK